MQFGDMLNEICKVSAIKATTALAKFLQTPLAVNSTLVEVGQVQDIDVLDDATQDTVNIFSPITGSLSGASFFVFSKQSALSLCDVLFNRADRSTLKFSVPEISALDEVVNIAIGNFLTPFAKSLQLDFLMHQAAVFDCGPLNTKLNEVMSTKINDNDQNFLKISFEFKHVNIHGYVLIVFDEGKVNTILKNLTCISDT